MIESMVVRNEERDKRLDHRSARNTFTNLVADGTNCSRFEAEVISDKAEVVFALGGYADDKTLQPGQMIWRAIRANEPAGKTLLACEFIRIRLTVHCLEEDREVRQKFGLSGKRQQQIVRMCLEARDQGALLTQEDLATLLDCDVKTIRTDIKAYQDRTALMVQTRGTVCDIGPGITHREKVIEQFIQGAEAVEIARNLTHSLKAVERYITTFCRIVYTQSQMQNTLKTAMVVGVSVSNVSRNLALRDEWIKQSEYKQRLDEIEQIGLAYWEAQDEKRGLCHRAGGRNEGREKDPRTISARKDFQAVLGNFFAEQFPQMGSITRGPMVKAIIELFDRYCPSTERMKAGQVLWYAVDEKETAGYGKCIEDCDLVPVTLDLFNREDTERIENGMKRRDRNIHIAARLFSQSYSQQGVLTLQDTADIMRLTAGTIGKYVRDYERQYNEILPRRGTIHDMGPTLTHKRIICHKHIIEGKTIEQTAREAKHSASAVTRYVKDYKRVFTCWKEGMEEIKIRNATGLSKSLIKEYLDLIEQHRQRI